MKDGLRNWLMGNVWWRISTKYIPVNSIIVIHDGHLSAGRFRPAKLNEVPFGVKTEKGFKTFTQDCEFIL